MPLKHKTETRLIVLLGLMLALSGIAVSLLPAFPLGAGPWAICFVIALVYPIVLYPMLKQNRADNEFRLMHWMPAGVLVLWFVFQMLESAKEETAFLSHWLTWAWTLPLVALGFFFLILFCLHVIRRRVVRIFLLSLLFVPYAAFALLGEQEGFSYNQQMASMLWNEDFWSQLVPESEQDTNQIAMDNSSSSVSAIDNGANLAPSQDPKEEEWRESLRAFQRRMRDLVAETDPSSDAGSMEEELPIDLQPGGTGAHMRAVATKPNNLPESGFGWSAFLVVLFAGYCGVLHDRARKRVS